jgi:hypothetical protein
VKESVYDREGSPYGDITITHDRIFTEYLAQYYTSVISTRRIRTNTIFYRGRNGVLRASYTDVVYGLRFSPCYCVYDRILPYTTRRCYDRNTESG